LSKFELVVFSDDGRALWKYPGLDAAGVRELVEFWEKMPKFQPEPVRKRKAPAKPAKAVKAA